MESEPADSSESKPLWWDNTGVIVIKAGDTLFRASRAILTKESSVFSSMFTLPQDADMSGTEMHEGDPYVELADSTEDVQRFLDATHLYREYYETPKSNTFAHIASILRMSTKYDVPHLRQRCITTLSKYYPPTLKAYDERSTFWHVEEPDNFAADLLALDLARQTDVPKLLPMIMYDIIRENSTADIMFGKPRPSLDGRRVLVGISNDEDKRVLFASIAKLVAAQMNANLSLVPPSYHTDGPTFGPMADYTCVSPTKCNVQKLAWVAHHSTKGISPLGTQAHNPGVPQTSDPLVAMHLDPLCSVPNTVGWGEYERSVCKRCVEEARTKLELTRWTFWEELPGMFGLPPWKELLTPEELAEEYRVPKSLGYALFGGPPGGGLFTTGGGHPWYTP